MQAALCWSLYILALEPLLDLLVDPLVDTFYNLFNLIKIL